MDMTCLSTNNSSQSYAFMNKKPVNKQFIYLFLEQPELCLQFKKYFCT